MRAIVSGAGISGLTLARCLADDGWQVTIVERAPGLRDEGYVIDFFGSGFDVAERLGLVPALRAVAYDFPVVEFCDARGRKQATISYEAMRKELDGKLLSIMRGDLERVLFETLPQGVTLKYGCTIDDIADRPHGVQVTLSDGAVLEADLLAGADGIHSGVREIAFGPEREFIRDLGMRVGIYLFRDAATLKALDSRFPLISAPKRMVGLFALRDGRIMAIFVHAGREQAPSPDPVAVLRAIFGDLDWCVPAALAHTDEGAVYFDAVAQIQMSRWHSGRVVLLGDACAAVSLLAGQGASLGMAMAYVLAEELRKAGDVGDGLMNYERRLKTELAKKQKGGRAAASSFLPMTRGQLALRNLMLRAARLPLLSGLLTRLFLSGSESVIH
ncbi:MAG TPA: FAD-dependent monooxygenase [Rhizomicrobium sp.]|nr:FAD-dependent monooxygenase [Rhizomicrobium sp.]